MQFRVLSQLMELFRRIIFRPEIHKYPFSSRLGYSNSRQSPLVIYIEPWGGDYTLLPEEELEIVAFGESAVPWFHVVEWVQDTQVYCENSVDFEVVQGDRKLVCGYQRRPESRDAD